MSEVTASRGTVRKRSGCRRAKGGVGQEGLHSHIISSDCFVVVTHQRNDSAHGGALRIPVLRLHDDQGPDPHHNDPIARIRRQVECEIVSKRRLSDPPRRCRTPHPTQAEFDQKGSDLEKCL